MGRPCSPAAVILLAVVGALSAVGPVAAGRYIAINCGGVTHHEQSWPAYYDAVSYGAGPIYQPNNSYTSVNATTIEGSPQVGNWTYDSDKYYSGSSNHISNFAALYNWTEANFTQTNYTGPQEAFLYLDERYGLDLHYDVVLPNGQWTIEFHFAESTFTKPGQRVFDVYLNDVAILQYMDPIGWSGVRNRPWVKWVHNVTIANKLARLDFSARVYEPSIRALRIFEEDGLPPVRLPAPPKTALVNCGGPDYVMADGASYEADAYFQGGFTYELPATQEIKGVSDPTIYRTLRSGYSFSYIMNFGNGDYALQLQFLETVFTKSQQRMCTVSINNVPYFERLDLVALGGYMVPINITKAVTVTNGLLRIDFDGNQLYGDAKSQCVVSGIRVYELGATQPPPATLMQVFGQKIVLPSLIPDVVYADSFKAPANAGVYIAIDCGSPIDVNSGVGILYEADTKFTGGVALKPNPVYPYLPNGVDQTDPYKVFKPYGKLIDDFIYASAREGECTYSLGPLPAGNYLIDFRFAEIRNQTQAGERVFDVLVNSKTVLTGVDIVAMSGAVETQLVLLRSVTVGSDGRLDIRFTSVTGKPLINALFVHADLPVLGQNEPILENPGPLPTLPAVGTAAPIVPGATPDPSISKPITYLPLPEGGTSLAINMGGPQYVSSFGVTFGADNKLCIGNTTIPAGYPYCRTTPQGPSGGTVLQANATVNITGTDDPVLFETQFVGQAILLFNVNPGIYQVDFFFATIDLEEENGQASIDLQLNDWYAQIAYDPYKSAGYQPYEAAPIVTHFTQVTGTVLKVFLSPTKTKSGDPYLNAIWIHAVSTI